MQKNNKRKILIWNGYYLPAKNYGGPLTSLVTMVETCSDENTFYIIAANHDYRDSTPFEGIELGWHDVGPAKVYYTDTEKYNWNYKELKSLIESVNPDIVWITGIIVPKKKWPLARICREKHIPYIISPRGEVNDNAFQISYIKKRLMSAVTILFGLYKDAYYHVTCKEEIIGLQKYFHVNKERIFLCPNIAVSNCINDRKIKKEPGKIKLVYISRIHEIKNLLIAIKAVNLLKGNAVFDIFGPLEDREYWAECEKEISKSPENIEINYCGALRPDEVFQKFMEYHAFLSPSKSENFGHAIAEALSAQCPVFILKGATPWDDIDRVAGYVSDENAAESFADSIDKMMKMDQHEYDKLLLSTAEFLKTRKEQDNAVILHKEMLQTISSSQN